MKKRDYELVGMIKPKVTYPYFPENTETYLDEAKTFQIKAFQPSFVEFRKFTHKQNFLIVKYSDNLGGPLKEARVFLERQILFKEKDTDEGKLIDSLGLVDVLEPGAQFGVYYLSKIPDDFSPDMPYCQSQSAEGSKAECLLAYIKQANEKNWGDVFFPLLVYRILKF
jgi:hypothetical protein